MTTELYLIRHAESEMNTQGHLIGGRSNETPLTVKGIAQAKALGTYLTSEGIIPTAVFASPAVRAIQTAEYGLRQMGLSLPVAIDDAIQELHQGDWEGSHRETIYTDDTLQDIGRLGKNFKAPNGESMNDVSERMLSWANTAANTDEKRVMAFSHGLAIRCFASLIENWSHAATYQTATPNASVSLFTRKPSGDWRLEYLGRGNDS